MSGLLKTWKKAVSITPGQRKGFAISVPIFVILFNFDLFMQNWTAWILALAIFELLLFTMPLGYEDKEGVKSE